jgi:hypothetical protein
VYKERVDRSFEAMQLARVEQAIAEFESRSLSGRVRRNALLDALYRQRVQLRAKLPLRLLDLRSGAERATADQS